jgi:phosphohistidine phosphatase SixA
MRLYLLRHGKAVDRDDWGDDDALRPLTKSGRDQATNVLAEVKPLVTAHEILTSPWTRARQTAELASTMWKLPLREVAWLAGEAASAAERRERISTLHDVVWVGHEPDFSALVQHLTGGQIVLKKCGLAILEGDPRQTMQLTLLLSPKVVLGIAE